MRIYEYMRTTRIKTKYKIDDPIRVIRADSYISVTKKGFTLIEIMVSVSIFAIVMTISAGSLFSILDANAKSQAQKSVINNLNLALESMSRTIRVGSTYHCSNSGSITTTADCSGGNTFFAFEPSGGDPESGSDQVIFRLNGTSIERSTDGGSNFTAITSPQVVVERLNFYVTGSSSSDNLQPKVLISVAGYAGVKERIRTDFNIQNTVTQRLLDVSI